MTNYSYFCKRNKKPLSAKVLVTTKQAAKILHIDEKRVFYLCYKKVLSYEVLNIQDGMHPKQVMFIVKNTRLKYKEPKSEHFWDGLLAFTKAQSLIGAQ